MANESSGVSSEPGVKNAASKGTDYGDGKTANHAVSVLIGAVGKTESVYEKPLHTTYGMGDVPVLVSRGVATVGCGSVELVETVGEPACYVTASICN